jgi:hypothetical protein
MRNTQPICFGVRLKVSLIAGAAIEMQTRSMYVTIASVTANTITQYRTRVGCSLDGCGRGTIRIVCHNPRRVRR